MTKLPKSTDSLRMGLLENQEFLHIMRLNRVCCFVRQTPKGPIGDALMRPFDFMQEARSPWTLRLESQL